MGVSQVFVGIVGGLVFMGIVYYIHVIRSHLATHPDVAFVMFFLEGNAVTAFKRLAVTLVLMTGAVMITGYGTVTGSATIQSAARIGTVLAFLGFLYFYRTIAQVTEKPGSDS